MTCVCAALCAAAQRKLSAADAPVGRPPPQGWAAQTSAILSPQAVADENRREAMQRQALRDTVLPADRCLLRPAHPSHGSSCHGPASLWRTSPALLTVWSVTGPRFKSDPHQDQLSVVV